MRKLAIFSDGWRKFFNFSWVDGCHQYVVDHNLDVQIYVFNSFGDFSVDEKFNIGEFNIFNLPNLKEFDGAIVDLNNIRDEEIRAGVLWKLREAKIPVISLVDKIPGFYYAGIDDYSAMYTLVEHVITEHGCSKLNYVGGPEENYQNKERLRAYKAALEANGIPYEQDRVYHKDYTITTGEAGFHHFVKMGNMPEAFICANDNIAVGLCHIAKEEGYKIPEDLIVTGFDNLDKASYFVPKITTAGFERGEIAYKAMELMERIWNGDTSEKQVLAEVNPLFQDSCGCKNEATEVDHGRYVENHILNEDREVRMDSAMMELKRELIECETFYEMGRRLPKHLDRLKCDAIYMVMNPEIANCQDYANANVQGEVPKRIVGYPKDMQVVMAYANGEILEENQTIQGLLPESEQVNGDDIYVFSPLHFREQEVGYLAFKNCDYMLDCQLIFEILNVLLESMENMYHRILLSHLNKELSQLYVMDSLTGLYNRMAYNRYAVPMYQNCMLNKETLMVMFVDVDRLKYINDNFGHDAGNVAIKTIAIATSGQVPEGGIVIRYGGDEFVVLAPNVKPEEADGIVERIQAHIEKMSSALLLGFDITASIGYVLADDPTKGLAEYINDADAKMYDIKRIHHKEQEKNKNS